MKFSIMDSFTSQKILKKFLLIGILYFEVIKDLYL